MRGSGGTLRRKLLHGRRLRNPFQGKMNNIEVDLNEVIANQDKPLRRLVGEAISLELQMSATAARLRADEAMLGQMLASLVDHARQSLPGGGKIILRTEHIEVDEIHARFQPGARCGEFVRLTVSDNGLGLSAEQLRTLFQQVSSRPASRSGTSLPLPLVAGVIKRRHGWIEASSQSGSGTTIGVYLPVANPICIPLTGGPGPSETILLVDDEVAIRGMVKAVLQRASYDVVEADTGVQALAVWEEHKDRVKLLLTDMVMPDGLTGRGLARRLLAGKPDLKVIYTSGFDLDAEAQQDTTLGTIRFLHKPYDMRCLLETVHQALAEDQTAQPEEIAHQTSAALAI